MCRKKRAGRGGPGAAGPVELTIRTGRVCVRGVGRVCQEGWGVKSVPVMEEREERAERGTRNGVMVLTASRLTR